VRQYWVSSRILDAAPTTKTSTVGRDDPVLHSDSETGSAAHLFDLKSDRHFGEEQLSDFAPYDHWLVAAGAIGVPEPARIGAGCQMCSAVGSGLQRNHDWCIQGHDPKVLISLRNRHPVQGFPGHGYRGFAVTSSILISGGVKSVL